MRLATMILFRHLLSHAYIICSSPDNFLQSSCNLACPWTFPSWTASASWHPVDLRVSNKEPRNPTQHVFKILRGNVIISCQTYGPVCCHLVIEHFFHLFIWLVFLERIFYRHDLKTISGRAPRQTANRKGQVVRWKRPAFAPGMCDRACCFVTFGPAQWRTHKNRMT